MAPSGVPIGLSGWKQGKAPTSLAEQERPAIPVSILLAGRRKADGGPLLDRRAQIPGVAGKEDRHAIVVLGAGRWILDAETFELGRVVRVEPPRRLKGCTIDTAREIVLGGKPRLQHVELQCADHADNPVAA